MVCWIVVVIMVFSFKLSYNIFSRCCFFVVFCSMELDMGMGLEMVPSLASAQLPISIIVNFSIISFIFNISNNDTIFYTHYHPLISLFQQAKNKD